MIQMIIAPLLFSTLVVGIAGAGDLKTTGRIGLKAIVYFEVDDDHRVRCSGLALVNVFQPGAGVTCRSAATDGRCGDVAGAAAAAGTSSCTSFPTSVIDAMARGDILQFVVFSTFFGVALAAIGSKGQAGRRRARERRAGDVQV